MPAAAKSEARLNFRLPAKLKKEIEFAAAATGQTVSDFAVATLVRTAREIIEQERVTRLTRRDWERFNQLIDDKTAKPNAALRKAAVAYKRLIGTPKAFHLKAQGSAAHPG